MSTTALIIIVLVLLLFGGGYYGHSRYGYQGLGGVVGLVLIILLILFLTGMFNTVRAQAARQPVPILKPTRLVTGFESTPPSLMSRQVTIPTARSMEGATRCEQIGTTITCDNGFTQQVERR